MLYDLLGHESQQKPINMGIITGSMGMGKCWGTLEMGEKETIRADGGNHDHSNHKHESAPESPGEARYVAGPGFELAIRATLARPLEVEIKGSGEDPKKQRKAADHDHRHETLEKRLDSIERALLMVVDQMKRIDEKLAALGSTQQK